MPSQRGVSQLAHISSPPWRQPPCSSIPPDAREAGSEYYGFSAIREAGPPSSSARGLTPPGPLGTVALPSGDCPLSGTGTGTRRSLGQGGSQSPTPITQASMLTRIHATAHTPAKGWGVGLIVGKHHIAFYEVHVPSLLGIVGIRRRRPVVVRRVDVKRMPRR